MNIFYHYDNSCIYIVRIFVLNADVALTDFGLAKDASNHDQARTFCGTSEYMVRRNIAHLSIHYYRKDGFLWLLCVFIFLYYYLVGT